MKLPIVAYGHSTLRKVAKEIGPDYPGLKELISDTIRAKAVDG